MTATLSRVDLPDLLLEAHAWTGYLEAYTHPAGASSRVEDLPISVAALLVAEACNVGLTPVVKPGVPALTREAGCRGPDSPIIGGSPRSGERQQRSCFQGPARNDHSQAATVSGLSGIERFPT